MLSFLSDHKKSQEFLDRLSSAERRLTALEVQWMDTLDRLKQMMGRVLKERNAPRLREAR